MNRSISKSPPHLYRWISLFFLSIALVVSMVALVFYSRERGKYPIGLTIGGVPVEGLDASESTQRLLQTFSIPIEAKIMESTVQIDPGLAGFSLNTEAMIADADLHRTSTPFWLGFWNYLWNIKSESSDIPLVYTINRERLSAYIQEELKTRYDLPSTPPVPIAGQSGYIKGTPGYEIPIESAADAIERALASAESREIEITIQQTNPGRPTYENLKIQLTQLIDATPFDGVVGIYLEDLSTHETMHFGYNLNESVTVDPDIAFTASSTIKIPILYSVYRHLGPTLDEPTRNLVLEMITKSENPASDALMEMIGGPLVVSSDLAEIGLSNTFIAGYFYDGAPLLQYFDTTSNSRTDLSTSPDAYNQTTSSELGQLLSDLYECAQSGQGTFSAVAPDKFTQASCQEMLNFLKQDRIGVLLEAGLPEGTPIAHKHGWISGPTGVIQNISDVGIIFSPSGDYVLSVYVYHPVQTVWEPVSMMVTQVSQMVYNYYTLPR